MRHTPEPATASTTASFPVDEQRRVDFKSYIRSQKALKSRILRERRAADCEPIDFDRLRGHRVDRLDDWMDDEDDYFDETFDVDDSQR